MTPHELAVHVDKSWKKLTGLPAKAKHEEGEFPSEVLKLIEAEGVDYLEFVDAWTELQE